MLFTSCLRFGLRVTAVAAAAGNVIGSYWAPNVPRPVGMVAKPVSEKPSLPYYAPVAVVPKPDPISSGSGGHTVAAVPKPGKSGAVSSAAVLKPDYQAALDRTNTYRQMHQVGAGHCLGSWSLTTMIAQSNNRHGQSNFCSQSRPSVSGDFCVWLFI
eukprot:GHUV01043741.1.p1 GENE.GHUV01043741.1~~GHUV01043741.1.p1  ORF type:complete len:157 (-),score=34.91 GHUV01043741.1:5-475(-)